MNVSVRNHFSGGMDASRWLSRAIGVSIAFHAMLVIGATVLNHAAVREQRPLVIDLRLSSSSFGERAAEQPVTCAVGRVAALKRDTAPSRNDSISTTASVERPLPASAAELQSPGFQLNEPAQAGSETIRRSVASSQGAAIGSSSRAGDAAAGERSFLQSAGSTRGMEQAKYLKEHFAYIKDMVQKQVMYPVIAKNMGWEGRVVISFTITSDGAAKSVKVLESRGNEVLNRSALDAVRKASPFPRPPTEAEIIIPIEFRLN